MWLSGDMAVMQEDLDTTEMLDDDVEERRDEQSAKFFVGLLPPFLRVARADCRVDLQVYIRSNSSLPMIAGRSSFSSVVLRLEVDAVRG
mmetsp:Transcript_98438/g.175315  ORF Transcript_98438/g.175315 Transcript_98438/m.175315 type:complete len:89 (+) Transcript_98438:1884-2150(+)